MKFRGFRGVREEGTDHTKLCSRIFTDLVLHDIKKSTFQHLTVNFITEWSQNLPFGPRPRKQKLLFSIFTYPIIHLINRKMKTRISVSQIKSMSFPYNYQNTKIEKYNILVGCAQTAAVGDPMEVMRYFASFLRS